MISPSATPTAPHIGHLYTSVIADVITRYMSLLNAKRVTFLNTGTDEHGLKIQRAAQSAGMEPKEFCDRISKGFKVLRSDISVHNGTERKIKDLALRANIKYDRFIRTTDDDHILAAQHFWVRHLSVLLRLTRI
jgi:methionyl-tRNA synthetase